ncbi:MAG: hypothetical protein MZV70_54690 [Desulfobacterales bacterium]|nr:hypothetical protein [Desulfobacterales bacterium]
MGFQPLRDGDWIVVFGRVQPLRSPARSPTWEARVKCPSRWSTTTPSWWPRRSNPSNGPAFRMSSSCRRPARVRPG